MTFKDIFPVLSRTWNFQKKNPGLSRRSGNPDYHSKNDVANNKAIQQTTMNFLPSQWCTVSQIQ